MSFSPDTRGTTPGAAPPAPAGGAAGTLDPRVVRREVDALAGDLERLVPSLYAQVRGAVPAGTRFVTVVGSGDSLYAGMSSAPALQRWGGVRAAAVTPLELTSYPGPALEGEVVVGVSASGNSPGTVQALAEARARGARTIALTTDANSRLAEAAGHVLVAALPGREPSPGIRSYQASLLGLAVLAAELAACRGERPCPLLDDLRALADPVGASAAALGPLLDALVPRMPAGASSWDAAGGGPNRGTARFCAAKVVECLGRPAAGIDLDEWWHVDRHRMAPHTPLLLLAPAGPARAEAARVAAEAARRGRAVFWVGAAGGAPPHPVEGVLPVAESGREELSPLLFHLPGTMLAGRVAEAAGAGLFPARPGAAAAPPR